MRTPVRGCSCTFSTQVGRQRRTVSKRSTEPTTMSEPVERAEPISTWKACSGSTSSESTKVRNRPFAARTPVLRAAPRPPLGRVTTRNRGSPAAYSSAIRREPSGEPSSTSSTSKSSKPCARIESRHSARYASTL